MAVATHSVRPTGFAATERRDAWWVAPLVQGLLLATLICYANWAAIQATNYSVPPAGGGGYLSPFYSPLIIIPGSPYSPALLILLPPILFRATCYYYRKAYYRSYFLDPPACAVGEPRGHGYRGETAFPFILQNLHRYAFYITFVYLFFLWRDVFEGACSAISGYSDGPLREPHLRRAGRGRRGRGAARRDRGGGRGLLGRPGLQVAAREGAHGDGRGRGGRRARHHRFARQLEGPLPRHHAGREAPERLAHGADPRSGGARARQRARGLGRPLRPHARRPHPAAQLRRPPVSAPGPRRRPHRPRDDPHPPGQDRPLSRRGRVHGVHDRAPAEGRRADRRRPRLPARLGALHRLSHQGRRARHRRHRPRLQGQHQLLGVHRRRPGARLRGGG